MDGEGKRPAASKKSRSKTVAKDNDNEKKYNRFEKSDNIAFDANEDTDVKNFNAREEIDMPDQESNKSHVTEKGRPREKRPGTSKTKSRAKKISDDNSKYMELDELEDDNNLLPDISGDTTVPDKFSDQKEIDVSGQESKSHVTGKGKPRAISQKALETSDTEEIIDVQKRGTKTYGKGIGRAKANSKEMEIGPFEPISDESDSDAKVDAKVRDQKKEKAKQKRKATEFQEENSSSDVNSELKASDTAKQNIKGKRKGMQKTKINKRPDDSTNSEASNDSSKLEVKTQRRGGGGRKKRKIPEAKMNDATSEILAKNFKKEIRIELEDCGSMLRK